MDIEEHPELIFGEEFCFPATATYYPTFHTPNGINVPAEFYGHQTIPGFNIRGQHYMGHQAEGTPRMCYVVPAYTHPPHGPHPLLPFSIANGRTAGTQNHHADSVEHPYYQKVYSSHYAVLPSAADMAPTSTTQPLTDSGFFPPCVSGQTVDATSERDVAQSPSQQSASVSSIKFQNHTVVPEGRLRGTAPWKRQLADRPRVPAKLPRARQACRCSHFGFASRQSRQAAVPSVQSSLQTIFSYDDHVPNVGSHLCKMSAENSQPCSKTIGYSKQRLSFLSKHNICKPKKPIRPMPSEIIAKSYTSRLHIGNQEGKIILKTDHYNRDDFKVVYPNAKFFVIKSLDEADVHKSIKYGVWSTSSNGNKKLDRAFREAQAIAANGSTPCPVNESFRFCGVAEMVGLVDWQKDMDFWSKDRWIGSFPVKWHIIKDIYNSCLRGILLENNENMPVTSSRDTQEIHYTPGTTMLKIFKFDKGNGCLLDEFMTHEEEESRRCQGRRFQLRQAAPHFMPSSMHAQRTYNTLLPKSPQSMPASMHAHHTHNALLPKSPQLMPASMHAHHTYRNLLPRSPQFIPPSFHVQQTYNTLLPRSDNIVMVRITREINDLTGKLEGINLDRHQGSWQQFGNLTSIASTTNVQNYGMQALENIVNATTYQAHQPLISKVKPALNGVQQYWKNIEITPTERPQPEAATSVSLTAPEEYGNEDQNALMHNTLEVPEMIPEEQKIVEKSCSLVTNSQLSESCSKPQAVVVAIGSILIPIAMSN
ncbi:hypothetical protein EJB05_33470 [Eragrostis curvula]|uniref:YTH domain-containing family protein n=1 Tax=Eragrostis curvula TaxID=38414 RepID=A0A5J9U177_9POAL|nr:hypothetical protein EJB05_33470 [Eragrostis curvula]